VIGTGIPSRGSKSHSPRRAQNAALALTIPAWQLWVYVGAFVWAAAHLIVSW